MIHNIPVKKESYIKALLLILNQLGLNMTELELKILAESINSSFFILTKTTRNILRDKLGIDRYTFNNYIKKLKDKGILQGSRELSIHPTIKDQVKDKEIHIIFHIDDSNSRVKS